MSKRVEQLNRAATAFTRAHHAWADDRNRPHPDATYFDSLEALIQVFEAGDVPAECRPLANAVQDLATQLASFDISEAIQPSDSFWAARQAVEDALKRTVQPKEFHLESMQELHQQGVSHEQIARMYALVDSEGRGKSHLVAKELATPGSVIGPDWMHPDALAQEQAVEKAEKRLTEIADSPCPETPEELFLQGVSAKQAAKMLSWSLDKTEQEWELFRLQAEESQRATEIERLKAGGAVDPQIAAATKVEAPKPPPVAADSPDDDTHELDDEDFDDEDDIEDESELEDEDEVDPDDTETLDSNLESFDVERLKALCLERGIGLRANERKAGMIAKLRALEKSRASAG